MTTALSIFMIIAIIILSKNVFAQMFPQDESSFMPTSEFVEAAKIYVHLHLIDKLHDMANLADTYEGRKWLKSWENERSKIIKEILLTNDEKMTRKKKLYPNWQERLLHFQNQQDVYLRTKLMINYDSRRQETLPRVTSVQDDKTLRTRLHVNNERPRDNERDLADPLATDEEIEHVLRFHRPFTNEERRELDEVESARIAARLADESDDYRYFPEDVDGYYNDQSNIQRLRTLVKKYSIISSEKIRGLLEKNYELLRESLRGKRKSELFYQERLFHAERVIAELDIWTFNDVYDVNDDDFNMFVPKHLRLLKDDLAYRKYLNHDDTIFMGNVLYGYKNRYDDPAFHGYGFEITAERIIGKRFQPMKEFYDEIHQFEIKTDRLTKCELKDLPAISSYLEGIKMWTFWFSSSRFKTSQWLSENNYVATSENKIDETKRMSIVRPKNYEKSKTKILSTDEMKNLFLATMRKQTSVTSLKDVETRVLDDSMTMKKLQRNFFLRHKNVLANKMICYLNSLTRANLLTSLLKFSPDSTKDVQQRSRKVSLDQVVPEISVINEDTSIDAKKHDVNKQKIKDTENLAIIVREYMDPNSNQLTKVAEDTKSIQIHSEISEGPSTSHLIKNRFGTGGDINSNSKRHSPYMTNNAGNRKNSGETSSIRFKHF